MKIIDLLNKIANGEEVPKKIKYSNETFTIREEKDDYANDNYWFTDCFCLLDLNEEVEIIEEEKKIPEKFKVNWEIDDDNTIDYQVAGNVECMLADKINLIIDYLKSKGE